MHLHLPHLPHLPNTKKSIVHQVHGVMKIFHHEKESEAHQVRLSHIYRHRHLILP